MVKLQIGAAFAVAGKVLDVLGLMKELIEQQCLHLIKVGYA